MIFNSKETKITTFDLVVLIVSTILLLVSIFVDLELSIKIVNVSSFLGNFTAEYGELPGYVLINLSFQIVLFKFIETQSAEDSSQFELNAMMYVIFLLLGIIISSYIVAFKLANSRLAEMLMTLLLPLFISFIVYSFSDQLDEFHVSASEKIIAITLIYPLLIVSGIKTIWGRVRYRDLADNFSDFSPWYIPQGYTGDRSFPSGHSSMAWLFLAGLLFIKDRTSRILYILSGVIWAITVSFGRILVGAHYLSDVTFSSMVGILIINHYYKIQKLEFKEFEGIFD